MYITHSEVLAESLLGMKRRCCVVEVVCPGVNGVPLMGAGSLVSSRRWSTPSQSMMKSRLPKRKAWDGLKTGGTHIPTGGSAGNSSEPKRVISLVPAMAKVAEKWAIR